MSSFVVWIQGEQVIAVPSRARIYSHQHERYKGSSNPQVGKIINIILFNIARRTNRITSILPKPEIPPTTLTSSIRKKTTTPFQQNLHAMSSHTHRKPCNSQGIPSAHRPSPDQPIAGPDNPHGNTLGRCHEKYVRRPNRQRRQDPPEPTTAPRPDFPRPGPDQPAPGAPTNHHEPAPTEDPALPG